MHVSGRSARGWLEKHIDRIVRAIDVYREAMSSVDWSAFAFEVVASRLHDGEYVSTSMSLAEWRVFRNLCADGLIEFRVHGRRNSEVGVMKLEIPPFGEGGILGIGGRPLRR